VKPDDLAGQIVGQLQRPRTQIFVSGPAPDVGLVPDFLHPLDPKEIILAPVSVFGRGIDDAQIPFVDMAGRCFFQELALRFCQLQRVGANGSTRAAIRHLR
jgi:hypothetical protein